jgi:hypothetical protein
MCKPQFNLEDEDGNPVARSCKPVCSSAWIDPSGKFYPVTDCGHSMFAEFHFQTYDLEGRGWVHLSFGNIYYSKKVRQPQIDTLYDALDRAEEHGYEYAANFRRKFEALMRDMDESY